MKVRLTADASSGMTAVTVVSMSNKLKSILPLHSKTKIKQKTLNFVITTIDLNFTSKVEKKHHVSQRAACHV